MMLIV